MKITVLGLWHLGCVTAACCSEHFDVCGIDFDNDECIKSLQQNYKAPLLEPGLNELINRGIESKRLRFISAENSLAALTLKDSEGLWVCYDTPVNEEDIPDVQFVLDRLERCIPFLSPGTIVLISSQIPAGTCKALERKYSDKGLTFAYSPENLRLGKALDIFQSPDRVIIGVRETSTEQTCSRAKEILTNLFKPFAPENKLIWMSPESAEMTKHGINAFLALSVTFANELARICELVGADAREVEQGLKSESRIGPKAYLRPGGSFAGGTLARDVVTLKSLAKEHPEIPSEIISAILESNEKHKQWAFDRLASLFNPLNQALIAVLGLTYKPNTSTLRRSSSVELCRRLIASGCKIRCFDPAISDTSLGEIPSAEICNSVSAAIHDANAVIISTEWPEFKTIDWVSAALNEMKTPVIIDANGFLNLSTKELKFINYITVGSSSENRP